MQFKLIPSPTPSLTVLGVTSQTSFTYLAHVKDLNFVGGGKGGKSCKRRAYEHVSPVSCKFYTKSREKEEVPKNLLAGIVVWILLDKKIQ